MKNEVIFNKEIVISLLAAIYVLDEKYLRDGKSTYLYDPFNENGKKSEIDFIVAKNVLSDLVIKYLSLLDNDV